MTSKKESPGSSVRHERIAASPRWNGRSFTNSRAVSPGFKPGVERPSLREILCGGPESVPTEPLPLVDPLPTWQRAPESGLRLTRLGHSTLLIEIDGARFLTDPVWGERVSPFPFAGPRRFHPPPVKLRELPPLDAIIVSHDHYDHLDKPTIKALVKANVPFVCSLGVGARLEEWGIAGGRITELDWWESTVVRGITVTAAPAQHFSGRGFKDRNASLWSSFHLQGPKHSFYYGADSGLSPDFAAVAARFGPFDAVALEIGAWHPAWGDIHLGPDGAIEAWKMLGGPLLPIHWGTFMLAVHPWTQPAERMLELAPAAGVELLLPRFGQPVEPGRNGTVDPWWRGLRTSSSPVPDGATDLDAHVDTPED